MSKESDTPRTDEAWNKAPIADYGGMTAMANIARQLERELNEALDLIRYFEKRNRQGYLSFCGMDHVYTPKINAILDKYK